MPYVVNRDPTTQAPYATRTEHRTITEAAPLTEQEVRTLPPHPQDALRASLERVPLVQRQETAAMLEAAFREAGYAGTR